MNAAAIRAEHRSWSSSMVRPSLDQADDVAGFGVESVSDSSLLLDWLNSDQEIPSDIRP